MADEMDAMFSSFMDEVSNIKSNKMTKLAEKFAGTPEEIVDRILSQEWSSPFEMMQVAPDIEEGALTKHYRKMSIMIHPDKCKHPRAQEAFQELVAAFNKAKDPAFKDQYADVIGEARERVKQRRMKENKKRAKVGKDPLELEGRDFEQEVMRECNEMQKVDTEKNEYAEKTRKANEQRLKQGMKRARASNRDEEKLKKQWEKGRDTRVAEWQQFVKNVESKEFKSGSMGHIGQVSAADIHHRRQERNWHDERKANEAKFSEEGPGPKIKKTEDNRAGLDSTYKHSWR